MVMMCNGHEKCVLNVSVAQLARVSVSNTEGSGFKSLLARNNVGQSLVRVQSEVDCVETAVGLVATPTLFEEGI